MRGMNIFTSSESNKSNLPREVPPEMQLPEEAELSSDSSILEEVMDEWDISIKFKQLDLEMKNLIQKHSWMDEKEGQKEINYDEVRRRHDLPPKNAKTELKDIMKKFEEDEKNGYRIGMSESMDRRASLLRRKSKQEQVRESEGRIEAILSKYKVRDFSEPEKLNRSESFQDILEEKKIQPKEIERRKSEKQEEQSKAHEKEFELINANVDRIMNQCLGTEEVIKSEEEISWNEIYDRDVERRAMISEFDHLSENDLAKKRNYEKRKNLEMQLKNLEREEKWVNNKDEDFKISHILDLLSVQGDRMKDQPDAISNFLQIKESISKIRIHQSNFISSNANLSPIPKQLMK